MPENYGGTIDPWSPYDLYDVLEGNIPDPMSGEHSSTEYFGFHIQHQGNSRYHVQYDGHLGSVMDFTADDYDDVLELVADLNELVIRANDFDYRDDKEGFVEWAGKMMTEDKEKAEENPELYIHIPEDVPELG